jgi:hypothetical protein
MEILGLAILIVGVLAYYGVFGIIETGAGMANREIKDLERDQKSKLMNKAASRTIDEAEYKKAVSNNTLIDSYDL